MQQLELFDFRRDILFEKDNQIAHFYDVLSESEDGISYAEHIDPKKKFSSDSTLSLFISVANCPKWNPTPFCLSKLYVNA